MIRYGINTFSWTSPFQTKDLPLLEKAKAMGFDIVEIPVEAETDLAYAKAAEAYKRAGLQCIVCAVMGASRDPAHEEEAIQEGGVAYLNHLVDAVSTMGGALVAGPLYSAQSMSSRTPTWKVRGASQTWNWPSTGVPSALARKMSVSAKTLSTCA